MFAVIQGLVNLVYCPMCGCCQLARHGSGAGVVLGLCHDQRHLRGVGVHDSISEGTCGPNQLLTVSHCLEVMVNTVGIAVIVVAVAVIITIQGRRTEVSSSAGISSSPRFIAVS